MTDKQQKEQGMFEYKNPKEFIIQTLTEFIITLIIIILFIVLAILLNNSLWNWYENFAKNNFTLFLLLPAIFAIIYVTLSGWFLLKKQNNYILIYIFIWACMYLFAVISVVGMLEEILDTPPVVFMNNIMITSIAIATLFPTILGIIFSNKKDSKIEKLEEKIKDLVKQKNMNSETTEENKTISSED